jgi:two-component system sensor histidine kinase BaeS
MHYMIHPLRLTITTKLFLVIMGISALVITAMGVAMSWSLTHSFSAFNEQQDSQRAQSVSTTLADLYAANKNWDFIRNDPPLWRDIVRSDGALREFSPEQNRLSRAQTKARDAESNNPASAATADASSPKDSAVTDRDQRGGMDDRERGSVRGWSDRPPQSVMRRFSHWGLLDELGQTIAGSGQVMAGQHRYPILYAGRTVGWLVVSPRQRRVTPGEQHFLAQQRQSSILIMLVATLMAIVSALLLARSFLAPVKRIAAATRLLIEGRYDTRADIQQRDEVGQLGKDFNQLAATLERNEIMRRDFVADISHELRTPLAILKGELEAIQDGIRKPDAVAMSSLLAETQALSQLVDDLYQLSLSDVGGLRYHMQSLDLNASIQQIVHSFQDRLAGRNLKLTLLLPPQPVIIEGDEHRLHQLLKNILENTLRYTDAGGQVELKLTAESQAVCIDLLDSGPGVSDAELPKLFERLYRVESSRNRATGGAGLGLPLCQTIVQAHGGVIQAQHSPLGGVWISIVLPYQQAQPNI